MSTFFQIALCCAVLTASLVSFRGLSRSFRTHLGFDPRGLAVASTNLAFARYDPENGRVFQRRVLDELSRVPGVEAAAYANALGIFAGCVPGSWFIRGLIGVQVTDIEAHPRGRSLDRRAGHRNDPIPPSMWMVCALR